MLAALLLNPYVRLAGLLAILFGTYYTGSYLYKVYEEHKYNKKIEHNYQKRLEKKDDIDSFQLNIKEDK